MLIPTCQNTCLVAFGQGWRATISRTVREQPTISTTCKATYCKTLQLALLPSTFSSWLLPKVRMEYLRYLTFHLIFSSSYSYVPIPLLRRAVNMYHNSQDPETILMKIRMLNASKREKIDTILPIINLLSVWRTESRQYISKKFHWCPIFKTIVQFFNIHR